MEAIITMIRLNRRGPVGLHAASLISVDIGKLRHGFVKFSKGKRLFRPEAKCIDDMNYHKLGKLLKRLGMDVTDSPENDRLTLRQRLFSGQQDDSCGKKLRGMLDKTVKEYNDMKKKLLGCYEDVIPLMDKTFRTEMSKVTEMRFPKFETQLLSKRNFLRNIPDTFEIVFTGETSSGKSTFLNVLLGEDILPSHTLHTTACIYRLHNSTDRRIEYKDENGTRQKICLEKDSSKLRKKFELMTEELLSNEGEHKPLRTIDVYWKIPSLHENVVLVDTPGIGERDALTEQVKEYVSKADGYVFIVDSARAGGIQDGGMAVKSTPKEEQITNLSNIFFICNRWDLVQRKDRDDVMKKNKEKLAKIYGQMEDWQVVEFNSKLELRLLELKANASDNFNVLLQSLETLMIRTIQKRLEEKYRWLQTFVMEVDGFIKARMCIEQESREEIEAKIKDARKELQFATKELAQCSKIETQIDAKRKELSQELKTYLERRDVQSKLFDWTNSAPKLNELKTRGPELIKTRFQDILLEWASKETGPLKKASVSIKHQFREVQAKLDLRIRTINGLAIGLVLTEGIFAAEIDIAVATILAPFGIIFAIFALLLLVVGVVVAIVAFFMSEEAARRKSIEQMSSMTEQAMKELLKRDNLEKFITDCFARPHIDWLTKFQNDAESKIKSTYEIMQQMENDLQNKRDTSCMLKPLSMKFQNCSRCLKELKKNT